MKFCSCILDNQPPVAVSCTEEQELLVLNTGSGSRVSFTPGSCIFHDNVVGEMNGVFINPYKTLTSLPAGDFSELYFKVEDPSGNEAKVQQRFLIHSKEILKIILLYNIMYTILLFSVYWFYPV